MSQETASDRFARYSRAIRGEPLPLALIDLDALERNVVAVVSPARERGKTVRLASKSLRSIDLLRRIQALAEKQSGSVRGVMAYCAAEASFLAGEGWDDILIAYPSALENDARLVAAANAKGAIVRPVCDAGAHLAALSAAATAAGTTIPVVVDVDVAYRAFGAHLGVRRSPLHDVGEVVAFVKRVRATEGLSFGGLLAYEAHIAGLADTLATRAMKVFVRGSLISHRRAVADALAREGIVLPLFNGGGTGSIGWTADEGPITEVAAGSGFLTSHLFDRYQDLRLEPAVCFALQVARKPAPGFVTCLGGGFVASGSAGPDRLPRPYLPAGLRLTKMEGAGEVQTPLLVPADVDVPLGSPVFFRHAKTGELSEHFNEYLLVRGERIEGRATTYRGAGKAFL